MPCVRAGIQRALVSPPLSNVASSTSGIYQKQQRPISAQSSAASSEITLTRWQKIENVIWDGGHRTPQERALVRRLDIFIMFVILFIDYRNIGPLTCRLSEIGAGLQLGTLCDCWTGLMSDYHSVPWLFHQEPGSNQHFQCLRLWHEGRPALCRSRLQSALDILHHWLLYRSSAVANDPHTR